MATILNMSRSANRDNLLGPDRKQDDIMNKANVLDNQGLVSFQRQIIKGMWLLLGYPFTSLIVCLDYGDVLYILLHLKQNKMKALHNWRRRWLVQNTLPWQWMKNLTYTPGFWLVLLIFSFLILHINAHLVFAVEFCKTVHLLILCLCYIQDNLDQHVDVTNSHLQVNIYCSCMLPWLENCELYTPICQQY